MRAARARTRSDLQFVTRRLGPTARRTPPASGRAEHRSLTARPSISRHEVIGDPEPPRPNGQCTPLDRLTQRIADTQRRLNHTRADLATLTREPALRSL